jgi:hypothetical protein
MRAVYKVYFSFTLMKNFSSKYYDYLVKFMYFCKIFFFNEKDPVLHLGYFNPVRLV